jgi:chemosensory pili system protein ChpA (sensor histidine kinase/response regulator)
MEDLLDRLYEGDAPVPPATLELLYATLDASTDLLGGEVDEETTRAGLDELYERYRALLGEEEAEPPLPPEIAGVAGVAPLGEEPAIDLAGFAAGFPSGVGRFGPVPLAAGRAGARGGPVVRVPLERLEELVRLVSELVVNRASFEQYFGDLTREVGELGPSIERLRRIAARLESEYEVVTLAGGRAAPFRPYPAPVGPGGVVGGAFGPAGGPGGPGGGPVGGLPGGTPVAFDELELDRYTEFHVVSRELTETASDVAAVGNELGGTIGDFDGYLARLGRLTSEVQDKLMRLRMVPLATLATRLHRAVRVTAAQQGKAVELVLEGREVELDKTVLEQIADPLLHLMRNAVDHGVEPPELRRVLGKPPTGRVVLRAFHEGTQVGIQVGDDGAGVEPELVRSAVVAGGYLTEPEAAALSTDELMAMLFLPGFTTAGEVSEVSGRGVGLDVVKATVERMKGTVALASTPGRGTTVAIRLPMTMAIIRVLMVTAARQTFAVPLAAVAQILRVERQEIDRVGREPVVEAGGKVYPLVHLGAALRLAEPPGAEPPARSPVLILDLGERRHALAVDSLVEAREVVVKPLGSHLRRVHGITGATLMGDGGVVLILNPAELVAAPAGAGAAATVAPRLARRRALAALDVLVVDDSLSVRRVLAKLVRGAGWNPIVAKDGVEALEILQRAARLPDVILLDIEMPRMDGYELAGILKGQDSFRAIPIVVVTSRAGAKHRERAFDLGVDDYVVKPYQDEVLLATIRRVARGGAEAATA